MAIRTKSRKTTSAPTKPPGISESGLVLNGVVEQSTFRNRMGRIQLPNGETVVLWTTQHRLNRDVFKRMREDYKRRVDAFGLGPQKDLNGRKAAMADERFRKRWGEFYSAFVSDENAGGRIIPCFRFGIVQDIQSQRLLLDFAREILAFYAIERVSIPTNSSSDIYHSVAYYHYRNLRERGLKPLQALGRTDEFLKSKRISVGDELLRRWTQSRPAQAVYSESSM